MLIVLLILSSRQDAAGPGRLTTCILINRIKSCKSSNTFQLTNCVMHAFHQSHSAIVKCVAVIQLTKCVMHAFHQSHFPIARVGIDDRSILFAFGHLLNSCVFDRCAHAG